MRCVKSTWGIGTAALTDTMWVQQQKQSSAPPFGSASGDTGSVKLLES